MPTQTRIAILYAGFLDFGGVETHLLSLFKRGDHTNFNWFVFASISPQFFEKIKEYNIIAVEWHIKGLFDFRAILRLIRLLKKHKVSAVHIHDPRAFIAGQAAASFCGIKTIYTVHISLHEYVIGRNLISKIKRFIYLQFSTKCIYKYANRILFVSRRTYQETKANCPSLVNKMSLINNGIDLELFSGYNKKQIRERLNVPINTPIICFVGRLDRQKGVDILLESARLLSTYQLDFFIWVVGGGAEHNSLKQKVRASNLENKIFFWGVRNDIPAILRASDVFVLPSRYEGMPMVILEAMASHLPIIATDVGDNSYIIENEATGFIVKINDYDNLSKKLRILLSTPLLRESMGKNAQQKSLSYSDIKMVDAIENVYRSLFNPS